MPLPDRFHRDSDGQEVSRVRVTPGTDTLTSRPVLIYEFDGMPPPSPSLESLPPIVESGFELGRARAVASLPPYARRWMQDEGPLKPAQLLAAFRALREAAHAKLVHGDIRPERFLLFDDGGASLTIEGFGIPWQPEPNRFTPPEGVGAATPAADVWALATAVQATGFEPNDATLQAVLEQCIAADASLRPTAEELAEALEQLLGPSESGAESAPKQAEASLEAEQTSGPAATAGPANGSRLDPAVGRPLSPTPRPTTSAATSASTSRKPVTVSSEPAEYPATTGWNRNRPFLLAGLMAAVVILALLSFFWPGRSGVPANATREATIYVVEVTVSPDDLPPVTVHLVSAPDGSSLEGGDRLGTAPRHLALDRAGTWSFRGSLGERVSPVIEIQVPDERSLELTIPPEPTGE